MALFRAALRRRRTGLHPAAAQRGVVAAFGQRNVVAAAGLLVGGAVVEGDVAAGDQLAGRWREVARVAGVHGGAVAGIPDHAHARAELAFGAPKGLVTVTAQAVVDGPVVADLPFVLHVQRQGAGVEGAAIGNQQRRGAGLLAGVVDREHPAVVAGPRVLVVAVQAVAQRVVVAQRRGEVGLQGIGAVADHVRVESHIAVTLPGRKLVSGAAQRALQHQHAEAGGLALGLIQLAGVEGGGVEIAELRCLARIDRDLEAVVGEAGEYAQAGVVVDQIGQVGEGLALVGVVVQRFARGGRIFQADLVLGVVAGQEPAPTALVAPP
ncbi:hypothetical protein G6F31_014575 [Rhizopus arrhizus]|nr:hypothetical protein G6F31_014575 [Rhizopus arrhizus]